MTPSVSFAERRVINMTLKNLKINTEAVIEAVGGEGRLRNRLLDMGLIPDTKIVKVKVAPTGDPMQISVRGYELTLRGEDADFIEVKEAEK